MDGAVMPETHEHVVTVRLTEPLKRAVAYKAQSADVTQADVIRAALYQFLDVPKPGL